MIPDNVLLILDTSVLVHLARRDATGLRIEQKFSPMTRGDRPLISTITEGEILGFARLRNWGDSKLATLSHLLDQLVRIDAGLPEVVDAYADLAVSSILGGHSTGDNDLWIAASAKATGAVLLTCDRDFEWLNPATITVVWLPTIKT